jgi:hypothetical protein
MGNRTTIPTPKACPQGLNHDQMLADLRAWADRFWDPIFTERGIVPDESDRESSQRLTFEALLLLSTEGATEVTGHTLAQAIHRVSQAPLRGEA